MVLVASEGYYFVSYSRRSGRGLDGVRQFTVVPLFHPRVYRKFLQNLQGKLNSRIKILKPRLYFFIFIFESKIHLPRVEKQYLKMKIKNRAGQQQVYRPRVKNLMREFTIVNMAFPQVTLNLLGV